MEWPCGGAARELERAVRCRSTGTTISGRTRISIISDGWRTNRMHAARKVPVTGPPSYLAVLETRVVAKHGVKWAMALLTNHWHLNVRLAVSVLLLVASDDFATAIASSRQQLDWLGCRIDNVRVAMADLLEMGIRLSLIRELYDGILIATDRENRLR